MRYVPVMCPITHQITLPMNEKGKIERVMMRTKVERDRYTWASAVDDVIVKARLVV